MIEDPDLEHLIIDATIVRVHQHAAGGKGVSKSGNRALARRPDHQDPHRRRCPLRLIPTPGQVHDTTQAEALIDGFVPDHVIGDKAYDTNKFRAHLASRASAVIPTLGSRTEPITYDQHRSKERHLVECSINKIKHFRRVATR